MGSYAVPFVKRFVEGLNPSQSRGVKSVRRGHLIHPFAVKEKKKFLVERKEEGRAIFVSFRKKETSSTVPQGEHLAAGEPLFLKRGNSLFEEGDQHQLLRLLLKKKGKSLQEFGEILERGEKKHRTGRGGGKHDRPYLRKGKRRLEKNTQDRKTNG